MSSRHVLASNFGGTRGPTLTDRYVVDYPIGYLRGGDAFDFWYRMDAWSGSALSEAGRGAPRLPS